MLAEPHAYASLTCRPCRADVRAGRSELFSNQIKRVDASISSIQEGRFSVR